TQLLLELQRAHACDGAEMLSEGGWAHVRASSQFVHVKRLSVVQLEPGDGLRNLLARGSEQQQGAAAVLRTGCSKRDGRRCVSIRASRVCSDLGSWIIPRALSNVRRSHRGSPRRRVRAAPDAED